MQKLELTQNHIDLIKKVCELEHNSLIRCHETDQSQLDALADQMNLLSLTVREFHIELSNAFYEFQMVFEDPEYLFKLDPHYFGVFLAILDIYKEDLKKEFPVEYPELYDRVGLLNKLYQEPLNLN